MGTGNGGNGGNNGNGAFLKREFVKNLLAVAAVVSTVILPVGALYLNYNYVPRTEVEDKYVSKIIHNNSLEKISSLSKEIEEIKHDYVRVDIMQSEIGGMKENLKDIKRTVADNGKELREIARILIERNSDGNDH